MSKTRIFALLVVAIMLIAVVTNPSKEKHEEAIKAKATSILNQQLDYKHGDAVQLGMMLFGDRIIERFVESHVTIKNYYLFSIIRIQWESQETIVGGGAFGKIWLSEKIDEETDKIIKVLKDL